MFSCTVSSSFITLFADNKIGRNVNKLVLIQYSPLKKPTSGPGKNGLNKRVGLLTEAIYEVKLNSGPEKSGLIKRVGLLKVGLISGEYCSFILKNVVNDVNQGNYTVRTYVNHSVSGLEVGLYDLCFAK